MRRAVIYINSHCNSYERTFQRTTTSAAATTVVSTLFFLLHAAEQCHAARTVNLHICPLLVASGSGKRKSCPTFPLISKGFRLYTTPIHKSSPAGRTVFFVLSPDSNKEILHCTSFPIERTLLVFAPFHAVY